MEILVPNAAVRNLIREDKIHQIYSAMQSGQDKFGMQTFNQSLATLYFQKQITLETRWRVPVNAGRTAGNDQPRRASLLNRQPRGTTRPRGAAPEAGDDFGRSLE
jgi:hypothetical protein